MKLELKNVKFYESMSEETNCFQADLFINGKKIACVKNSGQQILRDAEAYCKGLPKVKYGENEYAVTLETVIDDLFEAWLKVKADKKLLKDMEKGLMYGNKYGYTIITWNVPLKAMLMSIKGREIIRKKIVQLRVEEETILNTNIPKELFN